MSDKLAGKKLSVIVPVCERVNSTVELYSEYHTYLLSIVGDIEFIYVISDEHREIAKSLLKLKATDPHLTVLILNRNYGEATALQAGFEKSSGDYILKLPPYRQIETESLYKLFEFVDDYDLVLAKRWPRLDGKANQSQTRLFNILLNRLSGHHFNDMGCAVRLMKRKVLEEINLYGNQHRFIPLLAYQLGFRFCEVDLPQAQDDTFTRLYRPQHYLSRVLDLLTIIFLTQFNRKPLRFFGAFGAGSIFIGSVGLIYLAYERLMLDVALADRPILVMFALFFVMGIQLLGVGLVGETVIFTQSRNSKEYRIKEIIN